MFCRKCGTFISNDAESCPECGQACVPTEIEIEKKQEEKTAKDISSLKNLVQKFPLDTNSSKKKRGILYAVITVVIVLLVVFISTSGKCKKGGCPYDAEFGDYCATHVCQYYDCTRMRDYDSKYCYLHSDNLTKTASNALSFSNINIKHNSSYTTLDGTVTNIGSRSYDFVKIKGAFTDRSGTVLDTDWTYAIGSEGLSPGESTSFHMSVPKNYSITDCTIYIID